MTIKEAAALWNDPRADFLERWGEMFDVRLEDITQYHMMKFQVQRFSETPQSTVRRQNAFSHCFAETCRRQPVAIPLSFLPFDPASQLPPIEGRSNGP